MPVWGALAGISVGWNDVEPQTRVSSWLIGKDGITVLCCMCIHTRLCVCVCVCSFHAETANGQEANGFSQKVTWSRVLSGTRDSDREFLRLVDDSLIFNSDTILGYFQMRAVILRLHKFCKFLKEGHISCANSAQITGENFMRGIFRFVFQFCAIFHIQFSGRCP